MYTNLLSYGAAQEVTGSKHLLEVNGKQYLIDCGAWQGDNAAYQRNRDFTFPADKLSGVFISHAHFDHVGLLPKLVKEGYTGKIWSTPATRDLASIVMLDAAKIQQNEKEGPVYEESDVIKTINQFRCHFYRKVKKIDDNITLTFYNAGHILGSALLDVAVSDNTLLGKIFKKQPRHILFTGDLGRENSPIVNPPDVDVPAPEYIVMESTYGGRKHQSPGNALTKLTTIINKTIERGGKVIIPSFAIERAQELIYYLKTLMKDGKIPRVPVYVDSPMASNATGVFNIHPECFNKNIQDNFISKGKNPFSVASLRCISDSQESIQVAKSKKPCIVIAASGMCEAGRILNHLEYGVGNEKNTICIVGYMGENTLGRKIQDMEPELHFKQKDFKLKAEVQQLDAFSSHADYEEMILWLKKIDTSKLKKIFLVHGDKEMQSFLQQYLMNNGFKKVEIVEQSKVYNLF